MLAPGTVVDQARLKPVGGLGQCGFKRVEWVRIPCEPPHVDLRVPYGTHKPEAGESARNSENAEDAEGERCEDSQHPQLSQGPPHSANRRRAVRSGHCRKGSKKPPLVIPSRPERRAGNEARDINPR